jgi:succinylglutamate desuccinylase
MKICAASGIRSYGSRFFAHMIHRIIGSFGGQNEGTLVLVFGALHGNEPAGVKALEIVFQMLESEAASNPDFRFQGKLTGVLGNRQAFEAKYRFLEKDLNRQWTSENIRRIEHNRASGLTAEDFEIAELLDVIHADIQEVKPETLILLDLHTTSAGGGIFCIPTDESAGLRLAKSLQVPVILDLLKGVEGTLLRFAAEGHFQMGGFPKRAFGAAFEAGQHDDPQSVGHAVAAIVHCLRSAGCVSQDALKNDFETALAAYSDQLPKVTRLLHVHHIRPGDAFQMRPGYANFQPIRQGEYLADDVTGPIFSPHNGLILMPLYQPKGSDGFFIVEEL